MGQLDAGAVHKMSPDKSEPRKILQIHISCRAIKFYLSSSPNNGNGYLGTESFPEIKRNCPVEAKVDRDLRNFVVLW